MTDNAGAAKAFFGWRVVAAVFLLAMFGWGFGFYGPPVYLHAVRESRGWPLSLVSTAVTTHYLIGAFVVFNLPSVYRRWGIGPITKAGCVALATGVAGWALAREPWHLFLATALSGIGWATMGAAAVNAIVSPWFVRTRPLALSSAYNGASVGGIVFSPLWVWAIAHLGFPAASIVIGLVMALATWVLADLYFSRTPEQLGLLPDGETSRSAALAAEPFAIPALPGGELWRDRSFLTLAAGMAIGLFAQIGLLAHMFSLLVPALGTQAAGLAAGAATVAAIVGRMLFGWLMPPGGNRRQIASVSYGVQIVGVLAFYAANGESVPLLLAGVILFGFGVGNATSLPPLIAQAEFSRDDVGRAVPAIVAVSQATYAFAPAVFGLLRDVFPPAPGASAGSAPVLFLVVVVIKACAIASFLSGRRRRESGSTTS